MRENRTKHQLAFMAAVSCVFMVCGPQITDAAPASMAPGEARATVSGAMSTMYSSTYDGWICGNAIRANPSGEYRANVCTGGSGSPRIQNPHMSVSYHVRAVDHTTGLPLACGSSVRAGTEISYEFIPHEQIDVYWFATGWWIDSPYGYWVSGAQVPAGGICDEGNYIRSGDDFGRMYAALSIDPPARTVIGLDDLGCSQNASGNYTCLTSRNGSYDPTFVFAPTFGKFWFDWSGRTYRHYGKTACSIDSPLVGETAPFNQPTMNLYRFEIPQQTISCPITVVGGDDTDPTGPSTNPTTPTLSASGTGSCTTDTPYHLTMSATSPDSHPLRYLIDWDGDGSTDELVPPSGSYVASGATQNASRTFATAGHKTVQVRAQDDRGLLSEWATLSFDCTARDTSVDTDTDGSLDGTTGTVGTVGEGITANLSLRALPSLLRSGQFTHLSWSATNVSSCAVEGTNHDRWEGIVSRIGGEQSSPIRQQTVYTLTCFTDTGTLHKSVTVNVLPGFQER